MGGAGLTLISTIVVIGVLVFVHELGHFLSAKSSKIKVHGFALGLSPKIWKKKKGETAVVDQQDQLNLL